jgi:hypothetical protein
MSELLQKPWSSDSRRSTVRPIQAAETPEALVPPPLSGFSVEWQLEPDIPRRPRQN